MSIITVEDESESEQVNRSQERDQGSPQDQQGTQPQALLRFLSKHFLLRIFSKLQKPVLLSGLYSVLIRFYYDLLSFL
jgi:hypothetical protein